MLCCVTELIGQKKKKYLPHVENKIPYEGKATDKYNI